MAELEGLSEAFTAAEKLHEELREADVTRRMAERLIREGYGDAESIRDQAEQRIISTCTRLKELYTTEVEDAIRAARKEEH